MHLTDDMKRVVREQGLGFVATVRPDGTPAVSPKGTTSVWDDEHLVFLDLRSPHTLANLERNPHAEVNVVDPILRKGYRFAGRAEIIRPGSAHFEAVLEYYRSTRGSDYHDRAKAAVLIAVTWAEPLISPVYDTGVSETEVSAQWRDRHLRSPG